MSTPVLVTKLFIPRPRLNIVPRLRLMERLNDSLHGKLSLISAPAGFGKTTVVSEWVAGCGQPTAWLSLDDGDNDPARFLLHLVAALQTVAPEIGEGAVSALQSSRPPPNEVILTVLLNEIASLPNRVVLVLDDYHVIDTEPVDAVLSFVIEHLPPSMHLIISTRQDPQLPLARLRSRAQMTELRAADLRFTGLEAAEFLRGVMGLALSAEDVAVLEDRTEGWIAGLQLAALSMQGHRDISDFIRAFAGDNRYIVDYLVDEVLRQQPQDVRGFLLQTSILDRLHGSLCNAVTGQEEGSARLASLERGNFFVVPLDEQRHWYRYHQLFADVLFAHLLAEQPEGVPVLHRRASEWYEQNGSTADAVRHALAAEDFERAADLVELTIPALLQSRQEAPVLGWLRALPDQVVQVRPVLSVMYAATLALYGQFEGVEKRLRDAERWLDPTVDRNEMVVLDEAEFRRLPGSIALYRAAQALSVGDLAGTVGHARQARDFATEGDQLLRGSAAGLLGLAFWASGDLESGYRMYAECKSLIQLAGNLSDVLGCTIALADIRLTQGRLREAKNTFEQALQWAMEQGEPLLRGIADMHVGLSEIYREQNDLSAATELLLRSRELGALAGLPQNPYRWCVAMARTREAEGDLDGALHLLCEAERMYLGDFFPNVRPIPAMKARLWIAQGRAAEALGWAREQGLTVGDDLSYLREFDHLTLARALLAQDRATGGVHSFNSALELLERLLRAAEAGDRMGRAIEILVVQALAVYMHGDIPAALIPLERALTLAEPEGYVRMFVDEGPPMAHLLRAAATRGIMPAYTRKLLAACDAQGQERKAEPALPTVPVSQPLIEPLSERELEVLRLLRSELSGPDIARELVVALSTVRTHTKTIYSKLDVNSRRAAVKRAEELDLI
jgi:LuxR family maltose regulon positive regulatory protein